MITFDATQNGIVQADYKEVSWLFEITKSGSASVDYYYSTKSKTFDAQAYTAAIIPESFNGVTLTRSRSEDGIQSPDDLRFSIANKDNTITASDLLDALVHVKLVVNDYTDEEIIRQWKFTVESAAPAYQSIEINCVDFLRQYLKGDYPNTPLAKTVFSSDDLDSGADDNVCIPQPFGTAYVPLRSAYITDQRYYLLGLASAGTYTITEVQSPRDWPSRSVWDSGSYTFAKTNKNDADAISWTVFRPIIADSDNDGTEDACGLWLTGDRFLDALVEFELDATAALTSPEEVLEYFLEDIGVDSDDIDTGAGSTFATCATTYSGWGLAFEGAYFFKDQREKRLAQLLTMCHSQLSVEDKVRLRVIDTTSKATLTDADIVKDSFSYEPLTPSDYDSAYIAIPASGEPQDLLHKYRVTATGNYDDIADDVLELPFVSDTQDAQRLGILHYEYKFLKKARIRFTAHEQHLALEPGDWISIDEADYGGSYNAMIDSMEVTDDLDLVITAIVYSTDPDDWADLSPAALSPATDDSTSVWSYTIAGPDATVTSGDIPNTLPGRLRIGETANYILMEPADPLVKLVESGTEILRIGNLNGYLGYSSDIYGFAAGSGDEYVKLDPTNGLEISTANASGITIKSGGGIAIEEGGDITLENSAIDSAKMIFSHSGFGTVEIYRPNNATQLNLVPTAAGIVLLLGGCDYRAGSYLLNNAGFKFEAIHVGANDLSLEGGDQLLIASPELLLDSDHNLRHTQDGASAGPYFSVGADDDLKIYHSGTHGYIANETGSLYLQTGAGPTTALTINDSLAATFAMYPAVTDLILVKSHYADLAAAVTAASTNDRTIVIDEDETLTADLTIPSNVCLKFVNGAILSVASTKTLTIYGNVVAGFYQIFSHDNSDGVIFYNRNDRVPIQWFGAISDGVTATGVGGANSGTDNQNAIESALNSVATQVFDGAPGSTRMRQFSGIVFAPAGTYAIASTVTVPVGVSLIGQSRNTVRFVSTATDGSDIFDASDGVHRQTVFSEISIWGNGVSNTGKAISLNGGYFDSYIENVSIGNCETGVYLTDCWAFKLKECHIIYNTKGVTWANSTGATLEGNRIEYNTEYNVKVMTANGLRVLNNIIQLSEADGLIVTFATGCLIQGNYFECNATDTTSGAYDIQVVDESTSNSHNVSFISNHFVTYASGHADYAERSGAIYCNAKQITMIGNYFSPNYASVYTDYDNAVVEIETTHTNGVATLLGNYFQNTEDPDYIDKTSWAGRFINLTEQNSTPESRFNGSIIYSIPGDSGGGYRQMIEEISYSLDSSPKTFDFGISSGSRLKAVLIRVDTEVTFSGGGTAWTAAFTGGSTTSIRSATSGAANTRTKTHIPDEITTSSTDIDISPNAGAITGGSMTIVVYYEELVSLDAL